MAPNHDPNVHRVGFLVLPGFALMSFASATEPYRAANLLAGRVLYQLRFFGEGNTVVSSSGALVPVEPLPGRSSDLETLFVCAGGAQGIGIGLRSTIAYERSRAMACGSEVFLAVRSFWPRRG